MYQTKNERIKSYFYNMRIFHNTIKRSLYDKYTKNIDNLLEIACGKFGDLAKMIDNNIKHVVGYDINNISIEEGRRRIKEIKNKKHVPKIELYTMDLSKNLIIHNVNQPLFDVISAQFSFHYFFESEKTFNTIMSSIENNLKNDGIFMGCMFDGNSIKQLLNQGDFYLKDIDDKTKFTIESKIIHESLFGNKISVFIKDTVLDVPMDEYIVDFDKFVNIMKTRNFDLIESKMFKEYNNYNLNNIEKQVSFLNRTFVFKKRKTLCKNETTYLMKCEWSNENYKHIILDNYIKAIEKQMKLYNNEYLIIIKDNFLNNEYLLTILTGNIKQWYIQVHNMYLNELKNLLEKNIV